MRLDSATNTGARPQGRQRRSRYGCRNCKIRKLKCDESKPHCKKCKAYGVLCNFEHNGRDLESITERKSQPVLVKSKSWRLSPVISEAIWSSDGSTCFVLDAQDQALFKQYRDRTFLTIGGLPTVDTWGHDTLQAAFKHPCLMHGMLAVAAVHHRYLGLTASSRRTLRELTHWSQCTVLFAKALRGTIKEEVKDAYWATASTLGILSFASTDVDLATRDPWPLGPADSSDLEWLRLGAGKMKLWGLLDPLRPQSACRPLHRVLRRISEPLPARGVDGVPRDLAECCGMDAASTAESNAYHNVAHGLARLNAAAAAAAAAAGKGSQEGYGSALRVSGHMHGAFEERLREKDVVALVLLCLWYDKARGTKWWIEMRARYEHAAIRSYIQQYYSGHVAVKTLLSNQV